jgi:hypothetical protein
MKHSRQILMVLLLSALACGGANLTPSLPPTSTTGPSQPVATLEGETSQPTSTLSETAQPATAPAATPEPTVLATPVPQAFGSHTPLLILITKGGSINGDLWAWDGTGRPLRQLTNYGYNYNPVISPNGRYVAYDSIPKADAPWRCNGWPPANIWVLDIASGDAVRAVDQPADTGSDPCGGDSFIQRPKVAWSPDSKALAWGEHQEPDRSDRASYSLVSYDLEQGSQQTIVAELLGEGGITDGRRVDWGLSGIVDTALVDNSLILYDTNGTEISRTSLDPNLRICPIGPSGLLARWAMVGSNPLIYLRSCSRPSSQFLIDPLTGSQTQTSGRLELYSLAAPGGLSLFMTEDSNDDVLWHVAAPDGTISDIDARKSAVDDSPPALDLVAISPDGLQVVYLSDAGLMLYNGNSQPVLIDVPLEAGQEINWIGWGSTGWRIGQP